MIFYLSTCTWCNKKTNHIIFLVTRKRGLRLQCRDCGKIKLRYQKLNNLVVVENNEKIET